MNMNMSIEDRVRKQYVEQFVHTWEDKGAARIDPEVLSNASNLICQEGEYAKAIDLLNSEKSVDRDPLALKARGVAHSHLGEFEEAKQDEHLALKILQHEESAVLCNIAIILVEEGRFEDAIRYARMAREKDSRWYLPWVNEVTGHVSIGRVDLAWGVLDEMVKLWPECKTDGQLAWHLYRDGVLAILRGDPEFRERVCRYTFLTDKDLDEVQS